MASLPDEQPRYWNARRTAQATLIFAAVSAAFFVVYYLQAAFFCLFIAIILATALKRPIGWLERRGVPHATAVLIVFAVLVLLFVAVIGLGIPLVATQAVALRNALPGFYHQARDRLLDSTGGFIHQLAEQTSTKLPWFTVGASGAAAPAEFSPPALQYLGDALSPLLLFVAVLMLAFYWSLQEDRTLKSLLLLVPAARRDGARELVTAVQAKVGDYVFGQAIVCSVIGLLTFIGYTLIGLPHALPLGILSGVMEAVPVFGLLASAVPAVLIALSISGGKFFGVVVVVAAIHLSDNFFISPKIMGHSTGLHPIVTLLALVGFGALFGIPGAILAVLLASIAQLLLDRLLLSSDAQGAAPVKGRDHLSLLRHEVQEVLQDVRLNLRRKEEASTPTNDRFEEEIETIATELERMLELESADRETDTESKADR